MNDIEYKKFINSTKGKKWLKIYDKVFRKHIAPFLKVALNK